MKRVAAALVLISIGLIGSAASGRTVRVAFDFSQSEIGIDALINGRPVYILLDTGVDPSVVDLQRAEALHLKIDRSAGPGQTTGFGKTGKPTAFPTSIRGFSISGHEFGSFDALTTALSGLSAKYGRRVDAVIGYSFLRDKIALIDYPKRNLYLLDSPSEGIAATKSCGTRWSAPMRLVQGWNWPLMPQLHLGDALISATLDTGSGGPITLYQGALDVPGVRAALIQKGEDKHFGFRGAQQSKSYVLREPIGFARFELPPGVAISAFDSAGPPAVLANVGNKLFASMGLSMMLDYRNRTMTFFGDCTKMPR
jgi:hypothetical protein